MIEAKIMSTRMHPSSNLDKDEKEKLFLNTIFNQSHGDLPLL